MPRRGSHPYGSAAMAELERGLRLTPTRFRAQQVERAERLHDELEAETLYPLDYVIFRITGRRVDQHATTQLVGLALRSDLRRLIDVLSHEGPAARSQLPEACETIEQIAQRLGVAGRSVERWRRRGLRWRWVSDGDRLRVVVMRSAWASFHAQVHEPLRRRPRLSPDEQRRLIERARRLATARTLTPHRVAQHLARRTGRGVETIRSLLLRHDRLRPEQAIFIQRDGPLSLRDRRLIARAYRIGIPPARLARRFNRTRAAIHRIVRQRRAAAIHRLPLTCQTLPTFDRPDAAEVLLRHEPDPADAPLSTVTVDELPHSLRPIFRQPLLDEATRRRRLVRYHFLKHRAISNRLRLDRLQPAAQLITSIEQDLAAAAAERDLLVRTSLPLLLRVAMQHHRDHNPASLLRLLELGQETLIDAMESFDLAGGRTFEAYLTWQLARRFAAEPGEPTNRYLARRRATEPDPLQRLRNLAHRRGVNLPDAS